jgi:two-component system, NtrC family, sensor histidine kinase HydH
VNPKILMRVTGPAVVIGLLLFAACLVSVFYVTRLQSNMTDILSRNVASLQAAQELELRVRQLRFHNIRYLMDPIPAELEPIQIDQRHFEEALATARQASHTSEEKKWVRVIDDAYRRYKLEQTRLRADAGSDRTPAAFRELMDSHPIHKVVDPCQSLMQVNKEAMESAAQENLSVSRQANAAMVLLGLAGPVGGLVMGYGMARGLSQSIYRLSVRVKDMAQHLDNDVATVSVAGDGDLQSLDREMQSIVRKVEEVAERAQRHQRELLRADQLAAVGQLAAGVAHEIRNPLTGIKMLVEAALRPRNPTPLNAEDLRIIHGEVARLEQTVQGFLDFARLPAPQRCRCDLRDLATQARDLVRGRAQQQGVEVNLHGLEQPAVGFVDRGQMSTVLVNLLLNALDAMPQGGRIDVELTAEGSGAVRLAVSDTGAGIPAELADRLFTPFATTKPTGTGLGLSISRRILEEHGGRITASNRPEGGACFLITLPPPSEENYADLAGH